jgi:two-component system chemotaxis response regulator CheB
MAHPIKVLVADDSPTARYLLTSIINATEDMQVIGEASNGLEAVRLTANLNPDIVAMDLVMPVMNGLEATTEIMHATPTPIVMVSSSLDQWETDAAFEAVSRGALAIQQKPPGPSDPDHHTRVAALTSLLRSMAGVHVIHHWKRADGRLPPTPATRIETAATAQPEIVAIASSTGGPAALRAIFNGLPADFPVPVVVAQHIAPDFVPPLAEWLNNVTNLTVTIAKAGTLLAPGVVHLAPGDAHLRISASRRCILGAQREGVRYTPSCDFLLESVAAAYGPNAVGVVLTGMGNDGAHGLEAMHAAGAFTIAQDEKTSVVYSMPFEADQRSAVREVLPLPQIAPALVRLVLPEGRQKARE